MQRFATFAHPSVSLHRKTRIDVNCHISAQLSQVKCKGHGTLMILQKMTHVSGKCLLSANGCPSRKHVHTPVTCNAVDCEWLR